MESLLIHNKAALCEDALTASFADLLCELGEIRLINDLLGACRSIDHNGQLKKSSLSSLREWNNFEIELWPQWGSYGEPDFIIWLKSDKATVAGIVIEAKYNAPKSGEDLPDLEDVRDQLGKYAKGIEGLLPAGAAGIIIYLTASSFPPVSELKSSWRAMKDKSSLDPSQVLGWISWRDVDRLLRRYLRSLPPNSIARRLVLRTCQLLAHAGLQYFEGWKSYSGPYSLSMGLPLFPAWLSQQPAAVGWNRNLAPRALPTFIQYPEGKFFNGWHRPEREEVTQ